MEETLLKYGLPGIGLFAMGWLILYLLKDHRKERKEMRDEIVRMNEETNKTIRENTNILTGLKTLLENKK